MPIVIAAAAVFLLITCGPFLLGLLAVVLAVPLALIAHVVAFLWEAWWFLLLLIIGGPILLAWCVDRLQNAGRARRKPEPVPSTLHYGRQEKRPTP